MKSLTCVVIGDGSIFGVDIDEHKKVWHLNKMIKEEKMLKFPADQLTLYVAKKGGKWLKSDDPDVQRLEEGEVPEGIDDIIKKNENKMDPRYRIGNTAFNFPDEDDAGEDEIHVLVDIPEYVKKGLRILRYNQQDGSQELPTESGLSPASGWDWLATFFSSPRKASPSKKDS